MKVSIMLARKFFTLVCAGAVLLSTVSAQSVDPAGSKNGVVVSASSIASDVGASILAKGGNAVDAAVATAFALAVTWPTAGNIGGGGFMVIRTPAGKAVTIDYREKAPLKATPTMYLNSKGQIERKLTAEGYLAPGVPGTVRGLALAHKQFGRLPWRTVVMPAVKLAEEGFVLSEPTARSLNRALTNLLGHFPSSVEAYGKPGGGQWKAGDRIILTDLGKTLRAIAVGGPDAFYRGWIADRIASDMKEHGGLITKRDLAEYTARVRMPVKGHYKGYEITAMPPPSSGGIAVIESLNILSNFDLKSKDRYSPENLHLVIEAMRRAFLDRARYLGDPDFVKVPVSMLTSTAHAKELAKGIDPSHASNSLELGRDIVSKTGKAESDETTHFSVLDRNGMAVSNTYTLEGGYGSGVVVKGAGFILNNEMGDFNKKPGETNVDGDIGTEPNIIAPGKRMLSSMSPAIVTKGGRVVLITGSPGGRTIINTVLGIILNFTEFGMTGRQAVDAPRMHHQWLPDRTTFEEGAIPAATVNSLKALGHEIRLQGRQGDGNSIVFDPVKRLGFGVNDHRNPDSGAASPSKIKGRSQ